MTSLMDFLVNLAVLPSAGLKITLLLCLGWATHFLLSRHNPRWRTLLWRCVLVGIFVVPALTPLKYIEISVAPAPSPVTISPSPSLSAIGVSELPSRVPATLQADKEFVTQGSFQNPETPISLLVWLREHVRIIAFTIWGIVSAAILLRLLLGIVRVKKLIHNSMPAPARFQRLLAQVIGDLGCQRDARVHYSSYISTPFVAGFRRPIIVLPERMIGDDYAGESRAILAHEVAHLCSGDLIWMFVAKWVGALLWFHPLVWKLQKAHNAACEEVSDGVAADYIGDPERYANTLARVALEVTGRAAPAVVIPMARSSSVIDRLMSLKRKQWTRPLAQRWVALCSVVGMLLFAGLGGARLVYAQDIHSPSQIDALVSRVEGAEADSNSEKVNENSGQVILKVVDSDGLPVSHVMVGIHTQRVDRGRLVSRLDLRLFSEEDNCSYSGGEITLTREKLFLDSWPPERKTILYLLHEGRKIGAICEIARDDDRQVIEVPLEPMCVVHGRLDSKGLRSVGRPLTWTNVYVGLARPERRFMSHNSDRQRFEFLLPPGEYRLSAYGSGEGSRTETARPTVEVKPGQSELDLGVIDLPPTKLSTLIGQTAPEIDPIRTWKNGSPVKLADLRGKLVILHFGGEYPSTSRDLPRLVEIHESLPERDLVIIALYNCESMEQLEQRFSEASEKYGGEPDVPFRIAVDGGMGRPIKGSDRTIRGDTYKAYDISAYPTTVLVDREGRLVEERINLHDLKTKLAAMLAIQQIL